MIKEYKYESDVLAEQRGIESCIEITVAVDFKNPVEDIYDYSIMAVWETDTGNDIVMCDDLENEINKHLKMAIEMDASAGDLFQEWAAHIGGE